MFEGDDVLGRFISIVDMARFVRDRGARFWLSDRDGRQYLAV
ncbi:hypothetical protein MPLSOD_140008 [Mesorhizobium sp. SOD10]|nr:hypothetical protein MPLSOD_140008 [Mesorhizobium sp. SOD10]